jgi:4'-phosphopantetheinyl transferase
LDIRRHFGTSHEWGEGPVAPALLTGHVDVWRVRLDETEPDSSTKILSPDELARAHHFHFEKDRLHFARCRSALRDLLSRYLQVPAAEIRFEYQSTGKPEVSLEQNTRRLRFNVSHSAGLALIAVGAEHSLGVDIEKIRFDVDTSTLAEQFFSERERASLAALPHNLRLPAFFSCWTRKEAFLKATGFGLSFPLTQFAVSSHPEGNPEIEEIQGDLQSAGQWSLRDIQAEKGYQATVAIQSASPTLSTFVYRRFCSTIQC